MSDSSSQPHLIQVPKQFEFDGRPFPAVFDNQQSLTSLAAITAWLQANQALLERVLQESGAVLFRGFPIDNAVAFDRFSAHLVIQTLPIRSLFPMRYESI